MLNAIARKLEVIYAAYCCTLYTWMCAPKAKMHIDYDVRGVAKVFATDKLELTRDYDENFLVSGLTNEVTKRFDSGYYKAHGLIISTEGEVVEGSFKAFEMVDGQEVELTKDEWLAKQPYRPDQARIVYPDGTVNTNADFVQRVISRQSLIDMDESECEGDVTYALSV